MCRIDVACYVPIPSLGSLSSPLSLARTDTKVQTAENGRLHGGWLRNDCIVHYCYQICYYNNLFCFVLRNIKQAAPSHNALPLCIRRCVLISNAPKSILTCPPFLQHITLFVSKKILGLITSTLSKAIRRGCPFCFGGVRERGNYHYYLNA